MEIPDGTPDNTVRIEKTIHTQTQNQPFVSHTFLTFQIDTRQSPSVSSNSLNSLVVEGAFVSKAKSNRSSSTPGLPRCVLQAGSNADTNEPRLLPTTAAATKIAHPSDARGQLHVSRPFHVRFTLHLQRHIALRQNTADLQSMSNIFCRNVQYVSSK